MFQNLYEIRQKKQPYDKTLIKYVLLVVVYILVLILQTNSNVMQRHPEIRYSHFEFHQATEFVSLSMRKREYVTMKWW